MVIWSGSAWPGPCWLGSRLPGVEPQCRPRDLFLVPGAIAASFWTAGSVVLLFLALRRRLQDDHALLAAAIFAVATPTWSVSANMLWTHTVTQFAIAGTAFASSRRNWWLAGLFMSFGMLGRPHLALVAAAVGLVAAAADKSIKPAVGVAVPTLGSLLFLEGWNKWMFGVWSIGGAYAGKADAAVGGFQGSEEWTGSHPQLTNYLGFLFSFDRGFLIWTPIVLLFLPAVVRARREIPAWSWGLAAGGICYTIAQLRINYFAGGEGFYGYRHGLEILTCLVPALAVSASRMGRSARCLFGPILGLQLAAISLGAIKDTFYVSVTSVWSDNSFWLALRSYPMVVGTWLAMFLVVGALMPSVRRRLLPAGTPSDR